MSTAEQAPPPTGVQVSASTRFTGRAFLICNAYGLVLLFPTLLSMIAVSLLGLGILTLAIPLLMLAGATYFLPFGFGNPHIRRLAEQFRPRDHPEAFLVQLSLVPRLRSGLRALVEDADDIGWLYWADNRLVFDGDSVKLALPAAQLGAFRRETGGFRGLFLYPRVAIEVTGFPDCVRLQVAERSSMSLPVSRRINRDLYDLLSRESKKSRAPARP
jgi:hypothetical protein